MTSRIGVGIIGFGTVGAGTAKVLLDNAALIRRRVGVPVELIRIADLDVTRDRGLSLPPGVLTTDAKQVLNDPAVDIATLAAEIAREDAMWNPLIKSLNIKVE